MALLILNPPTISTFEEAESEDSGKMSALSWQRSLRCSKNSSVAGVDEMLKALDFVGCHG